MDSGQAYIPQADSGPHWLGFPVIAREIVLRQRPVGVPAATDFALHTRDLAPLDEGQLLVRNCWFSLDASTRLRMNDRASDYLAPYGIGDPLEGWAVGVVLESRSENFAAGSYVVHALGWRDYAVVEAGTGLWADPRRIVVGPRREANQHLGVLGPTGLTSWAGLLHAAELRDGDVVYVSAAAGAVGSLAVQIAKLKGHRVIGSAGSAEKVAFVRDVLGADEAFCYRDEPVTDALRHLAPEGIDVYFDNVGGSHLDDAIGALRAKGRVALCGSISGYNGDSGTGVRNLFAATEKGLTLRGFLARNYLGRFDEFVEDVGSWLDQGLITPHETIVEGLEAAPQAFIGLLTGRNYGKSLVRVGNTEPQGGNHA